MSQIREKVRVKFESGRNFYERYEKYLPAVSFFAGFIWDNLTVNRIDAWSDNAILLLYILLLTGLIILFQVDLRSPIDRKLLIQYRHWLPSAIQFLLGGLLSTYVVFYFQSASFGKTLIFVILLMGLLITNEFLANRLTNLYLLISLYFFVTFSFFIFFIPVITNVMNLFTYIAGGIAGLSLPLALIYLLDRRQTFDSESAKRKHFALVLLLYVIFNIFYFLNIIPPVPLSLKEIGIYHHAEKIDNRYILRYEKPPWYAFYRKSDKPFYYATGDSVFCYTAVFAPTDLSKTILHEWAYYSPGQEQWLTTDRMIYQLTGGREGGYRGFTFKKNIQPGEWEVRVLTEDDLILGSISFCVEERRQREAVWDEVIR